MSPEPISFIDPTDILANNPESLIGINTLVNRRILPSGVINEVALVGVPGSGKSTIRDLVLPGYKNLKRIPESYEVGRRMISKITDRSVKKPATGNSELDLRLFSSMPAPRVIPEGQVPNSQDFIDQVNLTNFLLTGYSDLLRKEGYNEGVILTDRSTADASFLFPLGLYKAGVIPLETYLGLKEIARDSFYGLAPDATFFFINIPSVSKTRKGVFDWSPKILGTKTIRTLNAVYYFAYRIMYEHKVPNLVLVDGSQGLRSISDLVEKILLEVAGHILVE